MSNAGSGNGNPPSNVIPFNGSSTKHIGNIRDSKDPWEVAQLDYDADTIYTRSTDGKGHYEQLRNVKISGALHQVVMQMIADGAFPQLRSIGDVVRDALVHRCHYYKDAYQQLAKPVNAEIILSRMEARRAELAQRDDVIALYDEQLRDFERAEDWGAIVAAVDDMGLLVDEWADTHHGRKLGEVIDRYAATARRRWAARPRDEVLLERDEIHDAELGVVD